MSDIFRKKLSISESLSESSPKLDARGNQKYVTKADVIGLKGQPYSAYFAAIFLDSSEKEIGRQIRWITDFSEKKIIYQLVFTTRPETKYVVLAYRGNIETPLKSDMELEVQELSSLTIEETTLEENFDDITKYKAPSLPSLTDEQEDVLEKKIVWLCAPPRSGTTWLGTQLMVHKENIIWHEPWLGLHLGVLRGTLVPGKDYEEKNYRFERVLDTQTDEGEYFFSEAHKNNWMPFLRKLILARTFSHTQLFTKNIIIKDPVGSNGMDIISECLPNSKILFLLRDGRDEVDSRMDMHKPDSWAKLRQFKSDQDRLDAIRYYSQLWIVNMKNIKKGFDNHNPKLKLKMKYEELINDTFINLKKIYEFINVKISDDELKKIIEINDFNNIPDSEKGSGKFNRSAKINAWKENFTEEEKAVMNTIMKNSLEEFGYQM